MSADQVTVSLGVDSAALNVNAPAQAVAPQETASQEAAPLDAPPQEAATQEAPPQEADHGEEEGPTQVAEQGDDAGIVGTGIRVKKSLAKMSAAFRAKILEADRELYPDCVLLNDKVTTVDTKDIFALRGSDEAPVECSTGKGHVREQVVLGFRDSGAEASKNLAIVGDAWHNLYASREKAEKIPEQPLSVCKVVFFTDTQSPCFEIFVRRSGDIDDRDVLSTTIWAKDLARSENGMVKLSVHTEGLTDYDVSCPVDVRNVRAFEDFADRDQLLELRFELDQQVMASRVRTWLGAPYNEVQKHRGPASETQGASDAMVVDAQGGDDAVYKPGVNRTRDALIQYLDKKPIVSLFVRCQGNLRKAFVSMWDYMRRIFSITAEYGHFWHYREQLWLKGKQREAICDKRLPMKFKTPRWMIKSWIAQQTKNADGTVTWHDIEPYQWVAHETFTNHTDPDAAAFLLKLGVQGEQDRQTRDLRHLVRSGAGNYFRGLWKHAKGTDDTFIVEVFMNLAQLGAYNVKVPGLGTRLTIAIDKKNPWHPSKGNLTRLRGSIVQDIGTSGASFVCLVRGSPVALKGMKQLTEAIPLFIEYVIDTVPLDRQMAAIEQIQSIPADSSPVGIDLKLLAFGDTSRVSKGQSTTAKMVGKVYKDKFRKFVQNMSPKPNLEQTEAMMNSLNTPSGLAAVQGPPGTGKTFVEVGIAHAHGSVKRYGQAGYTKVMLTAPRNEAAENLYDLFAKTNKQLNLWKDPAFVFFSGAYTSVTEARKREVNALALELGKIIVDKKAARRQAKAMVLGENIVAQTIRMAGSARKGPRQEWTFGFKLNQYIRKLAKQKQPLIQVDDDAMEIDNATLSPGLKAKKYLELLENLPHQHDKLKRKAMKTDLQVLEEELGDYYLQNEVKFVFCTLSASAHPILRRAFAFQQLIIDEFAHESLPGVLTVFGAHKDHIERVTICGDHMQGGGVFAAADSNVGYKAISRCLFNELCRDQRKFHPVVLLTTCYRMRAELLQFTSTFYNSKLVAHPSCAQYEIALENTLQDFFRQRLRDNFEGSPLQVAFDISGRGTESSKLKGTSTSFNDTEAKFISTVMQDMLDFKPPEDTAEKKYRPIFPGDLGVCTPYTGQMQSLRDHLKRIQSRNIDDVSVEEEGLHDDNILISTVNHVQGKERNIMFFSFTKNTGQVRTGPKRGLPINFVVDPKHINVALSRARVGRYFVGPLTLLGQMKVDNHFQTTQSGRQFFSHVLALMNRDNVVTMEEWKTWAETGQKPKGATAISRSVKAEIAEKLPACSFDGGKTP